VTDRGKKEKPGSYLLVDGSGDDVVSKGTCMVKVLWYPLLRCFQELSGPLTQILELLL